MTEQISIFDCLYPKYVAHKPIRLIELFAGYGSQALALKYLGIPFEHWKTCEWNYRSFHAYRKIHMTDDLVDYSKELSKDELITYLADKGISADWNQPMKLEQIKRLNEARLREIYSDISATHNLVDVSRCHANDLNIIDREKYTYILTYSFPCTDLSLAGLRLGMDRGSGTRSSLLYQVERILHECKEADCLPEVLVMENVTQVHGTNNIENWRGWLLELERLGYSSYWQDMIATDYGIPQIRDRTFCVSILGEYAYTFPKPIELEKRLKDLLEKNVADKYFISQKGVEYVVSRLEKKYTSIDTDCAITLTTKSQANWTGTIISKGQSIKIPSATKQGYMEATEGDGIDISTRPQNHRGTVQKGKAQTVQAGAVGGVVVVGNYRPSGHGATRIVDDDGCAPTVMENHGQVTAVPVGGVVAVGLIEDKGTHIQWYEKGRYHEHTRAYKEDGFAPTIPTNGGGGHEPKIIQRTRVIGGFGEKKSNGGTQWHLQNRIYEGDLATTTTTVFNPNYALEENGKLRIRKLTPRECFRLQGVKDDDIDKLDGISDSTKYHLAGDSICTTVLMALFGELCGEEWKEKVRKLHEDNHM